MLDENDIVKLLVTYLEKNGYSNIRHAGTSEHGYDIIAEKNNRHLYVEAKGQTSSKEHTKRWGKEFTPNQKMDHVAKAIYKAMKTRNEKTGSEIAIALPSDDVHRDLIMKVLPSLKTLDIEVYLVSEKNIELL
ncbi:MAG: hypothetical protein JW840_03365 [Candidatus Thermoplasmatota archaeon]|nr:hypothetical protein [Candidatus Thermoplasmatota archaeon]